MDIEIITKILNWNDNFKKYLEGTAEKDKMFPIKILLT